MDIYRICLPYLCFRLEVAYRITHDDDDDDDDDDVEKVESERLRDFAHTCIHPYRQIYQSDR